MRKRILIFSPDMKDQEDISLIVENEIRKLGAYSSDVEIQKYSRLNEPFPEDYLGHWYEVLVVFDRHISPYQKRDKSFKDTEEYRRLRVSFETHIHLCEEKNIPYVIYKGEIRIKNTNNFITEIFIRKDKISKRLEEKI